MPKLHKLSKRFLKRQCYKECLANGQRIQRHEEGGVKVKNTKTTSLSKSNNQPNGGESLLNGKKEEKSNININRKTGVKRRRSPEVESSSAIESNCHNGNRNHVRGSTNNSSANVAMSSEAPASAAASVNLKRRDQKNIIWVRIGLTDHPAYELYNPDNPNSNDSTTVWVEYASNGDKECVQRSQIKTGLQDRKRSRPNYDETGRRR